VWIEDEPAPIELLGDVGVTERGLRLRGEPVDLADVGRRVAAKR